MSGSKIGNANLIFGIDGIAPKITANKNKRNHPAS